MFWRYRQTLRQYYQQSLSQPLSIETLDLKALKASGIQTLILDFDGVLAPHASESVSDAIADWLREAVDIFNESGVYLLSNRPSHQRQTLMTAISPGIQFIWPKRKKPYPDDLIALASSLHQPIESLAMVDDRLATGVLAACIAGVRVVYIHPAKRNLSAHPISETFFMVLRWLERRLV